MTAGRGILHSEMPAGDGDNVGLQLWINLRAKDKVDIPLLIQHHTLVRTLVRLTNIKFCGGKLCVHVPWILAQLVEPKYQELLKEDIPHVNTDGVHVAVIAGESYGASVSSYMV